MELVIGQKAARLAFSHDTVSSAASLSSSDLGHWLHALPDNASTESSQVTKREI
jgi:hypothetical protein